MYKRQRRVLRHRANGRWGRKCRGQCKASALCLLRRRLRGSCISSVISFDQTFRHGQGNEILSAHRNRSHHNRHRSYTFPVRYRQLFRRLAHCGGSNCSGGGLQHLGQGDGKDRAHHHRRSGLLSAGRVLGQGGFHRGEGGGMVRFSRALGADGLLGAGGGRRVSADYLRGHHRAHRPCHHRGAYR